MQGWARGPSQPCKGHATEKKKNATSTAAERARQRYLRREYRLSLEKDISSLQKKLRQEVDTHKALERAFRRTLGVLPRFSPSLTPKVQELLAEVAVLEEEVINLEECIVALRQGLYNEAVFLSSSKQQKGACHDVEPMIAKEGPFYSKPLPQLQQIPNGCKAKRNCVIAKLLPPVLENKREEGPVEQQVSADADLNVQEKPCNGQCNSCASQQSCTTQPTSMEPVATPRSILLFSDSNSGNEKAGIEKENELKAGITRKIEPKSGEFLVETTKKALETLPKVFSSHIESGDVIEPNLLSEEMVLCMSSIFLRLTKQSAALDWETSSNVSHSTISSMWSFTSKNSVSCNPSRDVTGEIELIDPYKISGESERRNVGPYQYYQEVINSSFDYSKIPRAAALLKKLMNLLERLRTVDLRGLAHQQKLSFWINIYNVCMMHAFLEHGIPDSPHKVVALMGKAVINVGGHHLSALAIEHFILRLPCDFGNAQVKSKERTMEGLMRSTYGLDWPEPLVSFALCCGSWSSPALRVYTPQEVENELEIAKNEYLQAAVWVTPSKIVIPKMLEWYMRDFAKDAESLIDWVSEQLPSAIGKSLQNCLAGRHVSEVTEVMPYDFSFRYLFAVQSL
ncbi:hypothetical protein GOP47_0012895 [Adiantum capillus-veneris]|uniref:Uncharacterized protein n=1 Tax=Adiantum capillus-veneris TaxID=13818 RepID=A0A9D4UR54_ADICA|nr:hypothetical protein GOP47_0012133 [Adiantum capillus-veneris]KAI5072789.1 hypothetical protein GOP47_0012895 [Adiantum capillus-veneris]